MPRKFEFDPEKALAATAYLAKESGETMYTILKMLYLVDRLHLERYGRPVTGDRFFAMAEGPAPTEIYDWMKFLRGDRKYSSFPKAANFLSVDPATHDVFVIASPDIEVLSATDLECIDAVLAILHEKGGPHIRDLSHDAAWKATSRNRPMDVMTIAASLKDGPILAQHIADRFPDNS